MQIVIFDMDGTLVDSSVDITASVNHVRCQVYGLGPLQPAEVVEAINRDDRNLALLFYGRQEYEKAAQELFEAHYHEQCVLSPRPYDGIVEVVRALRGQGVQLSVATNAPSRFARRMLAHLDLAAGFDRIIGAEAVRVPKPDPEMVIDLLDGYGYRPDRDRAMLIGDSGKDIEAARAAGIEAFFASWGFGGYQGDAPRLARPCDILSLFP
jgi:phosphoglycolate phosphatase